MKKPTVAVLGTGAMGSRMVKQLLKAEFPVVVYNRSRDRLRTLEVDGATVVGSPREAARRSQVVISMVTDDKASREVWLDSEVGAAEGLQKDAIAIESSTVTPGWVRELGGKIEEAGARYLAAPVVGSRPQADAGGLIYLVGGAAATLAAAKEVLQAMGSTIHHIGGPGDAATMKLAVNALFGCQVAVLAEVVGLIGRAGIDVKNALSIMASMPVSSPAMQAVGAQIVARSFAPLFPVKLVEKDFCYLEETARALAAELPACSAVGEVYASAHRKGLGGENISGIVRLYQ